MQTILSVIFTGFASLISIPLLFVIILAGFGMLPGQKPERAFQSAWRVVEHLIVNTIRLAVRLAHRAVSLAVRVHRQRNRHGRH